MSINQLKNYLFQKNNVRTCEMNQEPWFVATDICDCLWLKPLYPVSQSMFISMVMV